MPAKIHAGDFARSTKKVGSSELSLVVFGAVVIGAALRAIARMRS